MPQIDLSILNQRQTPAFYADVLANRPAAGFIGRIFVSTNTFEFYRDNGTGWDLIGGPGAGTITGSGATGQVSFWNGASTITGSNDLFWDNVNGHFGIGTTTPGTALDVKHDQNTVVQLEQITATNDIRIAFINSGVGLWRLGAFYNAGANDFGLFDIAAAAQPVTVKRTTGQVLIGTSTVGSGKLVVASATGDNGVQIVGASAPSLRIDNAETGPTKRAGLGISTAVNNFIQGSVDGDICFFSGSTTPSPILFGIYATTNVQEAARISAARRLLINTTTDAGYRLDINGTTRFGGTTFYNAGAGSIAAIVGGTNIFSISSNDTLTINPTLLLLSSTTLNINSSTIRGAATVAGNNFNFVPNLPAAAQGLVKFFNLSGNTPTQAGGNIRTINIETTLANDNISQTFIGIYYNPTVTGLLANTNHKAFENTTGNVCVGTTSGNLLIGTGTSGASKLRIVGLPTSAAGLSSGDIYSNLGVLTIVP
jgi:hypothetical protein